MNRVFKGLLVATSAALAISLSGCGTVVRTGQDFQAVHYSGGAYSKQKFENCVVPGDRRRDGLGDANYYYPAGERTFQFDGTDAPPIAIQTKDGVQVEVSGFITFKFTENCALLQKFHEDKGLKQQAFFKLADSEGGTINYTSDGWGDFLKTYFGVPTRDAMNSQSLKYGWRALYSDTTSQNTFKSDVVTNLPDAINRTVGDGVVAVTNIQIVPPQPPQSLKDQITAIEEAKGQAKAEEEKANAQETAQAAKNKLAAAKYLGTKKCLEVYSEQSCLTLDLADRDKIQFYPQGSGVIVQPR